MLKIFLSEKWDTMKELDPKNPIDKNKLETEMKQLILMAAVWSFGSEFDVENRSAMTLVLNEIVRSKANVDEKYLLSIEEDWVFDDKICAKIASQDD